MDVADVGGDVGAARDLLQDALDRGLLPGAREALDDDVEPARLDREAQLDRLDRSSLTDDLELRLEIPRGLERERVGRATVAEFVDGNLLGSGSRRKRCRGHGGR